LITPANETYEKVLKAFEGAAWFKDEFGFLKKGTKSQPHLPPEEIFNLDGSSLVKTIHDRHQAPILKKPSVLSTGMNKGEVDLTNKTDGDSASHSSSSSLS
jgi:hypothetical protein